MNQSSAGASRRRFRYLVPVLVTGLVTVGVVGGVNAANESPPQPPAAGPERAAVQSSDPVADPPMPPGNSQARSRGQSDTTGTAPPRP